ncbi:MAG: DUF6776 family protein [Pseudomonadota bacterium]
MNKPKMVLKPASPGRSRALLAIVFAAVIGGGYLLYEMGRFHAGFNRFASAEEIETLEARIVRLEAENRELNEQRVRLETLSKTEQETYREVGGTLRELQGKIQEQREAIAFYRGIISPGESESGLRIQDLQVVRGSQEARYNLRMVLVQVKQHHRQVYGKVEITVDGARDGERVSLPLASLLPEGNSAKWNYGFRYFQDFDRELELPEGFRPEKINVELAPSGRGNQGIRQTFDWSTASG